MISRNGVLVSRKLRKTARNIRLWGTSGRVEEVLLMESSDLVLGRRQIDSDGFGPGERILPNSQSLSHHYLMTEHIII